MKTVYLCGGINGLNDGDCRDWREAAKEFLAPLRTLDPMRRDYRGIEEDSVEAIVTGDLRDIAEADFVLVNATRPSWGTAMEIVYARMLHKQVVVFTVETRVSPWLRFHADYIGTSLHDACARITARA